MITPLLILLVERTALYDVASLKPKKEGATNKISMIASVYLQLLINKFASTAQNRERKATQAAARSPAFRSTTCVTTVESPGTDEKTTCSLYI